MREHTLRLPAASTTTAVLAVAGAIAALAFGILGLGHFAPRTLIALGVIAVGAALVGRGGVVTHEQAHDSDEPGETDAHATLGEGAGDEILGGSGAVICGVLALVGLAPVLLLGVAVMSAAGGVLLSAWGRPKIVSTLEHEHQVRRGHRLLAASIAMMVTGVGALTLGIVALTGVDVAYPLLASAVIVLGAALLGAAFAIDALAAVRAHGRRSLDVERTNPLAT